MSQPADPRSTGISTMQEICGFTLEPDAVRGCSKERTTIGASAAQGNVDPLDFQFHSVPVEGP
ncbi:MAG: hypothetical protein ACLPYY_01745 [Acidimicrobiales bacterium]